MIKPLNNHVLLKKVVVENKTASGIILSTNEKDEENIGVVCAVSDDVKQINVNDKVVFDKYAAVSLDYQEEKYLLVSAEKIFAIVE